MRTMFPGYEFHPGEASVFVEIYLPKKSRFQRELYNALTDAFDPAKVRAHLGQHEARVREFMKDYYKEFLPEAVETMGRVMDGYSLYEVDGVFYDEASKMVIEERTQVVRIMFRPTGLTSDLTPDLKKRVIREYLRFTGKTEEFPDEVGDRVPIKSEDKQGQLLIDQQVQLLIQQLRLWECQVAMLVFGYIVYKICTKMRELNEMMGVIEEDSIWVASLWNLVINRVVRVPAERTETLST